MLCAETEYRRSAHGDRSVMVPGRVKRTACSHAGSSVPLQRGVFARPSCRWVPIEYEQPWAATASPPRSRQWQATLHVRRSSARLRRRLRHRQSRGGLERSVTGPSGGARRGRTRAAGPSGARTGVVVGAHLTDPVVAEAKPLRPAVEPRASNFGSRQVIVHSNGGFVAFARSRHASGTTTSSLWAARAAVASSAVASTT